MQFSINTPASASREVDLGNGWFLKTVNKIYRKQEGLTKFSQQERAQARNLSANWDPKVKTNLGSNYVGPAQAQRCPAVWVDNVVFNMRAGMSEPCILLGEFEKDAEVYGQKEHIHGLVVAAGGHYESMGKRAPINYNGGVCKYEDGHMCLEEAADRELIEEVKIKPSDIRRTVDFGYWDNVFNDPRRHGIRHIYLRHTTVDPQASDELKAVFPVPLSQVQSLINGAELTMRDKNGKAKQLSFVLNHDYYLDILLRTPPVQEFIREITETARRGN